MCSSKCFLAKNGGEENVYFSAVAEEVKHWTTQTFSAGLCSVCVECKRRPTENLSFSWCSLKLANPPDFHRRLPVSHFSWFITVIKPSTSRPLPWPFFCQGAFFVPTLPNLDTFLQGLFTHCFHSILTNTKKKKMLKEQINNPRII